MREFFILLALSLVTVTAAAAPTAVQIALHADATVRAKAVLLADLADVTADDDAVKRALDTLQVAHVPQIGAIERLSRAELARIVQARLASRGVTVTWTGANAVQLRAQTYVLDSAGLLRDARRFLLAQYAARFSSLDATSSATMSDIEVPPGALKISFRMQDGAHFYARRPVWADLFVDGAMVRSVVLPFVLTATQPVLVAKRDLPADTVVAQEDFESRVMDVSELADVALPAEVLPAGSRTRKAVMRGQTVLRDQLTQTGRVYRGDTVNLIVATRGVSVETRAVVQQEGSMGQLVRVKPDSSSEVVSARLIGTGVVQVEGQ